MSLGEIKTAIHSFQYVLSIDPHHFDAYAIWRLFISERMIAQRLWNIIN